MPEPAPAAQSTARPASRPELERALTRLQSGTSFKSALEQLLAELDQDDADALMLLMKESRGAWMVLLAGSGGEALFIGNAFSGSVTALIVAGYRVTIMDRSNLRLRFALAREAGAQSALKPARGVQAGHAARLPFKDASFDLVVQEDGLPCASTGWGHDMHELARVTRGELLLTADNRLAYKRSIGRRGHFHVPRPLEFAGAVLRPVRGERTRAGYRALFRAHFAEHQDYALYPHAREFSHIVGLDGGAPHLTVGPRERRNVLKVVAQTCGLFNWLTPSFAIIGQRKPHARARVERLLDGLSERLGEPRGELDYLVATRSNCALIHTSGPEGAGGAGRYTLHIPLNPAKRELCATHQLFTERVRAEFPGVPVPEPLFRGEIDGLWLMCERRLDGLTAPHYTGNLAHTRTMFSNVASLLEQLVVQPSAIITQQSFEALLGARFDLVRSLAGVPSTVRALDRMRDRAREVLVGRELPLVLYHADLRGKHVQVAQDGAILGFLDWGASEELFLPYVDLLHLVVHQRKQEMGGSSGESWRSIRDRKGLRPHEAEVLAGYCERMGVPAEVRELLEAIFPALVAGMAEKNWDYSRPQWVYRQWGV